MCDKSVLNQQIAPYRDIGALIAAIVEGIAEFMKSEHRKQALHFQVPVKDDKFPHFRRWLA